MHCPSCDVLIKDKLSQCKNVKHVEADFHNQSALIEYHGAINVGELNSKISQYGYQIVDKDKLQKSKESMTKKLLDFGVIALIIIIIYFIAKEADIIPNIQLTGEVNYLAVFMLGLVASTSTCMATSGALFMATVGKISRQSFLPGISFNIGRILSYGFFGLIAGMVGKTLITNFQLGTYLTFFVSIFMILLGLDLTGIFYISNVVPSKLSKGIFEKLEHLLIKNPKKTAFLLGAITYILPCGFTQTVQVYALGLATPIQSALTMIVFALGTVPALLLIGSLYSFTQTKYYSYFIKTVGVLIFIIGLTYISNTINLFGITLINNSATDKVKNQNTNVLLENGKQIIHMDVTNSGYSPNQFTVRKGIPVKWIINGKNVFGCQGYLMVPLINFQKALDAGNNIIEFTPKKAGTINFSCGMGMYGGRFLVID